METGKDRPRGGWEGRHPAVFGCGFTSPFVASWDQMFSVLRVLGVFKEGTVGHSPCGAVSWTQTL